MFNREWGKKHREAARQENDKAWRAALDRAGVSPEEKDKIAEELAAEQEERKKEPA